ncbi:hypothetical protein CWI36_0474p0040, partial [Hamiltosporidium magnivora]
MIQDFRKIVLNTVCIQITNKYHFHVSETQECIEYENDNGLECLVETSESHDENLLITTIPTLRKQMVSNNTRERIIEKTLEEFNCIFKRYLKTGLVFVDKRGGNRCSKLTLEIKESLQTYVNLECTKTLYELAEWFKCTFNVDVSTSKIDRALREFHYTLKRRKSVPERRNLLSTLELGTNYATSFRELEVDNDDKNF